MEENTSNQAETLDKLYDQKKFDDIISLLPDEELLKEMEKKKAAELYLWRGLAWYGKKEYDKAITDYSKGIEIRTDSEEAFYNRGLAYVAKKEFDKGIKDFDKVLDLDPVFSLAYVDRGSSWRKIGKYDLAIADYSRALEIDCNNANAYYNRGLAQKERNIDPESIKYDFEKFLELTTNGNDPCIKYAKYYIENLNDRIKDKELSVIAELVTKIKDLLLIEEDCITHYTSLSVIKSLILDGNKFRISEGNFINDPSEGTRFFNFLNDNTSTSRIDGLFAQNFSLKPFIGSFVAIDKCDDLNMWRFYGKEDGVEAKGCAITLLKQKFIDEIKDSLSNEDNKDARLDDESDLNFYRVVYVNHTGSTNFYIPDLNKSKELKRLMVRLKKKVNSYKGINQTSLEKYLNCIAFLFKSDAYKDENEVRLVVKGIEFKKEYNMDVCAPRVYIELISIKDLVTQITLGPKVDRISEWVAAFHYRYEEKVPKIVTSDLPYK